MIAFPSLFSARSLRSASCALALLAVLALPFEARAQAQPESAQEKKQLTEKVREGLTKFGPLQEAKQWDSSLALLTDLQKLALPGSYDEHLLAYIKGQVYLQIDQADDPQHLRAIEPLELALRVSDQRGFFEVRDERKVLKFLSQLHYGEGSAKGIAPAKQEQSFIKAADYLKRLIDSERTDHTLNTEDVVFYAYLQLQRAQTNPDKPDPVLLAEVKKLSEEGLLLNIAPRAEFYRILLSTLLAQDDYPAAAEILELLLKKDPTKKDDWTQLNAIYLSLAGDDKNKEKAFENNLRAILTYERAQAAGFLKTPKDNFQLVATYYNIGQVEPAARLLEANLKSGSIESDQKYWTYLAQWYQQINQEAKAIEVLNEAAKHFPNSGEFDFMAAVSSYALEKYEDALQQATRAATKGRGDKTWEAWSFMAYTAFELRKYEEALEAANKALSYPDSKKDNQLAGLRDAAEKAIKDRNAQTEALRAKQK